MTFSARAMLVVLGILSVFALGMWASSQATPQLPNLKTPDVISGSDFGFRVERRQRNRVVGRLVVRVNGEWIEAHPSAPVGVVPLGNQD